MKKEIKYISNDGSIFDTEEACKEYEKQNFDIKPLDKNSIDLDKIIDGIVYAVQLYIAGDDDWDEYISENMVMHIYGENIWEKLNQIN